MCFRRMGCLYGGDSQHESTTAANGTPDATAIDAAHDAEHEKDDFEFLEVYC